jgi:hypothetical protein
MGIGSLQDKNGPAHAGAAHDGTQMARRSIGGSMTQYVTMLQLPCGPAKATVVT